MTSTRYISIREKLERKLFSQYGKSVTFKKKDTPTYNSRGEEVDTTYTSSSIEIIPYNIMEQTQSYQPFGTMAEGDLDAAVRYTVDIDQGDIITMESQDYEVKEVERNYLPENVVTIIRLTKVQA